jgi:hypothetical protein
MINKDQTGKIKRWILFKIFDLTTPVIYIIVFNNFVSKNKIFI